MAATLSVEYEAIVADGPARVIRFAVRIECRRMPLPFQVMSFECDEMVKSRDESPRSLA
jgi:hypothetical protein